MLDEHPIYGPFFGVMGVGAATIFSVLGAAYGTAKASTAIASMAVLRPQLIIKSLLPIVMAGVLPFYGMVVSVLITGQLDRPANYPVHKGFIHLGAGIVVGLACLAAGVSIGVAGEAGIRGTAQQTKLFSGMLIILIFAEALGIYGLIVAVNLYSKAA